MKKLLLIITLFLLGVNMLLAQTKKVYTTTSGEWIFSYPVIDNNGSDKGARTRYSPVFNFQWHINADAGKHWGLFTGLAIRNIGFIYDVPNTSEKKKYRTYNLGIPVGLKIGNLQKVCFLAGYELELPFNYKEKTFIDERKVDKFNVWFSERTPAVMHSVMCGIQLPRGTTIKFKYYITNFFNKNFESLDANGNLYKPFLNFEAHLFYVSLNFTMLKNRKFIHAPKSTGPVMEAMLIK
ncbi:MAG: hypothetical protein H7329_04040 [Opitutaceae bacterium]|nr:hypothetical protein [Cytophagales bacterium]